LCITSVSIYKEEDAIFSILGKIKIKYKVGGGDALIVNLKRQR
jgi:hypothetical protein